MMKELNPKTPKQPSRDTAGTCDAKDLTLLEQLDKRQQGYTQLIELCHCTAARPTMNSEAKGQETNP